MASSLEQKHWEFVRKREMLLKRKVKIPTTQEELNKLLDKYSKISVAIDHTLDQVEKKTKDLMEKIHEIEAEHTQRHELLMIRKQKIVEAILKSDLVTDIIQNELNQSS